MKKLFIQIAFLASVFSLNLNAQIISTISGTIGAGFSGDGGQAINAQLNNPSDIAIDSSGNKYIADNLNHRIRKINPAGVISTFAGTGVAGFSGDGGAATSAQLNYPFGVAVDALGNIYIGDYQNSRVRKVNTAGIISTFAGTVTAGFSGDGGAASNAQLASPFDVAIDAAGNVYISDAGNSRIRKVNTAGVISTFAGNGVAGFSGDGSAATLAQMNGPRGITVDALGNVYFGDFLNNRIRKVNTAGIISTFAGTGVAGATGDGGVATSAQLSAAHGICFDAAGNAYIADYGNSKIRKVNTLGVISTYAGTGVPGFSGDGGNAMSAQISNPVGSGVDAMGNLFIADYQNHRIRKVTCVTPTITVSSGSICAGNSFTMVPNGASTYTFQGGNSVVSPTANSSFTVVGTNTNGCVSSIAAVSNITVNALPTVSASTSNSIICGPPFQQTSTLTANGAGSFTWNPGGIGTSIAVSPSVTSQYTVTGTDANGCMNSSVFTQSVSSCTGLSAIVSMNEEISIYPNPTTGEITIIGISENENIETYNALGQRLDITPFFLGEGLGARLDLSKENAGIYFIRIGTGIKKTIKE